MESTEGRFRAAETKLKLRAGFRSSSVAFAQVNKREYKRKNRSSQFRQPRMPPNDAARLAVLRRAIIPLTRLSGRQFHAGIMEQPPGEPEAVHKVASIYLGRRQKEAYRST